MGGRPRHREILPTMSNVPRAADAFAKRSINEIFPTHWFVPARRDRALQVIILRISDAAVVHMLERFEV
jgi:hypothetical protein